MTVAELIELLEGENPDALVRVAIQPDYPMAETIGHLTPVEDDDGAETLWIATVQDREDPYGAPRDAWQ